MRVAPRRDSPIVMQFADLFSGAGGLSLGFHNAGFEPVVAVEQDHDAAASHAANFGAVVVQADISTVTASAFSGVDIVVGGPPCQGFSRLGQMNGAPNDEQNGLWEDYANVVEIAKPIAFVLENVPAFLKSKEFAALKRRLSTNANAGCHYTIGAQVLDAADFNVPQKRKRAFVIGIRGSQQPRFPNPLNEIQLPVLDILLDLKKPKKTKARFNSTTVSSGWRLHFKRNPTDLSLRRYALIPPGGNRFDLMDAAPELTPSCWLNKPSGSTDVFGRLRWNEPSVTIRTEFFKPEKGRYLHPDQDRAITHLEAALLQGFPFEFKWVGSKSSIARQIGNAVPPPLAEAVGRTLMEDLKEMGPTPGNREKSTNEQTSVYGR